MAVSPGLTTDSPLTYLSAGRECKSVFHCRQEDALHYLAAAGSLAPPLSALRLILNEPLAHFRVWTALVRGVFAFLPLNVDAAAALYSGAGFYRRV